jgi:hypothetical protein
LSSPNLLTDEGLALALSESLYGGRDEHSEEDVRRFLALLRKARQARLASLQDGKKLAELLEREGRIRGKVWERRVTGPYDWERSLVCPKNDWEHPIIKDGGVGEQDAEDIIFLRNTYPYLLDYVGVLSVALADLKEDSLAYQESLQAALSEGHVRECDICEGAGGWNGTRVGDRWDNEARVVCETCKGKGKYLVVTLSD